VSGLLSTDRGFGIHTYLIEANLKVPFSNALEISIKAIFYIPEMVSLLTHELIDWNQYFVKTQICNSTMHSSHWERIYYFYLSRKTRFNSCKMADEMVLYQNRTS